MSREHEIELLRRVQAGDRCAGEELLERHKGLVLRIVRGQRPLIGLDRDDFLGIGMAALWQAALGFDPSREAAFATFATVIVRRAIAKAKMQERRSRCGRGELLSLDEAAYDDEEGDLLVDTLVDPAVNVEREVVTRELVRGLLDRERDIVRRRVEGESYRAIGAALGVSAQRVVQIEERARRRLAAGLEGGTS